MYATSWYLIIFANILLGINQGFTWSSTVVMKIDLIGEKNRGLAMGINESAGYLAVGATAFLTSFLASSYGMRPYPFLVGILFAVSGLILSSFFIKDTRKHVRLESINSRINLLDHVFWDTTWKNKNLGSISQAGLVNNLNDGMMWGIFPLLLASRNFSLMEIGKLVAIYPLIWGIGQLFMGKLADHWNKKSMIFWGMFVQGVALLALSFATEFYQYILFSVLLGMGTAAVYPTFFAAISDYAHPLQRAESIGTFRLWRDLGYAVGALITGIMADLVNLEWSVITVALITLLSSLIIRFRMS
jgi:MFS family permease